MRKVQSAAQATFLDIVIDGFEKNEVFYGFHHRVIPIESEERARSKYDALTAEVTAWKGPPIRVISESGRQLAAWPDVELRQAGRGILIRVRAPWFGCWWDSDEIWTGNPLDQVYDWLAEERVT
jgi:hypothetical protein